MLRRMLLPAQRSRRWLRRWICCPGRLRLLCISARECGLPERACGLSWPRGPRSALNSTTRLCCTRHMIVRHEKASDRAAVHALVKAAFGRSDEADLVDRLREDGSVV